jgi:hypothetical protein
MSPMQTDPSQTQTNRGNAGAGAVDDDPLSHLHKMSTTAGLGSGDYVAVNGTAVFVLILGLASALALMAELLLIIPIAAIVAAVVALRQISHSNGTQTGKGLVILGLLLALGFGGFVVTRAATEGMRTRDDRQAIGQVIATFGEKVKAGDIPAAYALFSPDRFGLHVTQAQFADRLKIMQDYYGKLKEAGWNGLAEFNTDDVTGTRYAATALQLTFEKSPTPLSDTAAMRQVDGKWQIDEMPALFPTPATPKR